MAAPNSAPVMVHVVDDDESLRTAVSRLLRAAGYEVRNYGSAGEFLLARDGGMRGCLLLDVRMPGPSGLQLHAALEQQGGVLPVIFLTGHGDIPMSVQAIKAGAVDFLTKPVRREALLSAVKTALAREEELYVGRQRQEEIHRRLGTLTSREREVFARVVAGQPNKQIAAELDAAERTVKAHRAQVMVKMGAASLAALVQTAEELRRAGVAMAA